MRGNVDRARHVDRAERDDRERPTDHAKLAGGQNLSQADQQTREYVGDLGEPIKYGSDDILPLLSDCGFKWVRSLDFNELALEMLGDYKRERMFRFQHIALASVRAPAAAWP